MHGGKIKEINPDLRQCNRFLQALEHREPMEACQLPVTIIKCTCHKSPFPKLLKHDGDLTFNIRIG